MLANPHRVLVTDIIVSLETPTLVDRLLTDTASTVHNIV